MISFFKSSGYKFLLVIVLVLASQVSVFAATSTSETALNNSLSVIGGVLLLIGAIVAPAFKSSKVSINK